MARKNAFWRVTNFIAHLGGAVNGEVIAEELDLTVNDVRVAIRRARDRMGEEIIVTTDEGYVDGLWHATSVDHGRKK